MSNSVRSILTVYLLLAMVAAWSVPAEAQGQPSLPGTTWVTYDDEGSPLIHLYFFWSSRCPHCTEARPVVETMARFHPWLTLHSHELLSDPANVELYRNMAARLGKEARSVPGFMFCGEMLTGFDTDATTGRMLQRKLVECYQSYVQNTESE